MLLVEKQRAQRTGSVQDLEPIITVAPRRGVVVLNREFLEQISIEGLDTTHAMLTVLGVDSQGKKASETLYYIDNSGDKLISKPTIALVVPNSTKSSVFKYASLITTQRNLNCRQTIDAFMQFSGIATKEATVKMLHRDEEGNPTESTPTKEVVVPSNLRLSLIQDPALIPLKDGVNVEDYRVYLLKFEDYSQPSDEYVKNDKVA